MILEEGIIIRRIKKRRKIRLNEESKGRRVSILREEGRSRKRKEEKEGNECLRNAKVQEGRVTGVHGAS